MGLSLLDRFQIAHTITLEPNGYDIPLECLPKQNIKGEIRPIGATEDRCLLNYKRVAYQGSHGKIQLCYRSPAPQPRLGEYSVGSLCVKLPEPKEYSLCSEAILQWKAAEALEVRGIRGAVPRVFDIFQYAGETRFSMEFIDGVSSLQYVAESEEPHITLFQILAQLCLLLSILQTDLHLDHRDLKADNIWIQKKSTYYSVELRGKTYRIWAPFQVVLLDFGFACLGGEDGRAILNLSEGVLPPLDPCPKEGRDLFQFLASLLSIHAIAARFPPAALSSLTALFDYKGATYKPILAKQEDSSWTYFATSDAQFRHPPLHPERLLQKLSTDWKEESGLQVE
jgi:serine/threonine protein kinase